MCEPEIQYCRFCAEPKSLPEIFDLKTQHKMREEIVTKLLILETNCIDLTAKELPETVCHRCYDSLLSSYEFYKKIQRSQTILTNLLAANLKPDLYNACSTVSIKQEQSHCLLDDKESRYSEESFEASDDTVTSDSLNNAESERIAPWLLYPWTCGYCCITLCSVENLRTHNKNMHGICCSFKCVDCNATEDNFDAFIDHVISHRGTYKDYCPYCHLKVENWIAHMTQHMVLQRCETCGETFQTGNSLQTHSLKYQILTHNAESLQRPEKISQTLIQSIKLEEKNDTNVEHFLKNETVEFAHSKQSLVIVEGNRTANNSWTSYDWNCVHCKMIFDNMAELRTHSKDAHNKCYAFNCVDCNDQFSTFLAFIEHVRQHRNILRNYCQYCNQKFIDCIECDEHALTHWSGTQKICFLCGEICPDVESLNRHRKVYKLFCIPRKYYKKRARVVVPDSQYNGYSSWTDYEWTCQECCRQMPDIKTLRAHAQDFHNKCFTMKCMDCLRVERNYRMFVKHVTNHRPYLKKYCQYCNQHFNNSSDMNKHVAEHSGPNKPCDGCGQIFGTHSLLSQHLKDFDPPRNKGTLTAADKTCDLCGKVFKLLGNLRLHRLTHDKNRKPEHICDICGKSYFNSSLLKQHYDIHDSTNTQETCKMCNKVFKNKQRLKAHVRSHVNLKLFTCDGCGKQFRTKWQLAEHIMIHMKDNMKYKCMICSKSFSRKNTLTTHINIHSTSNPFCCKFCEKTFNSWSNCNKHMIRKHGVPLAKTKLTAQGRIDIDKETGQVVSLDTSKNIKEWISEVIKPMKKGRKRKGTHASV